MTPAFHLIMHRARVFVFLLAGLTLFAGRAGLRAAISASDDFKSYPAGTGINDCGAATIWSAIWTSTGTANQAGPVTSPASSPLLRRLAAFFAFKSNADRSTYAPSRP